jgi:N6-adenosine-specific RNA methylase IME4
MTRKSKQSPRARALRNRRAATRRVSKKPRAPGKPGRKPIDWVDGEDYNSRAEQPATLPARIKIGTRHRKELGDIEALAADINTRGLLHPIVVDLKGNLIAGERRLAAWKLSNFRNQAIPVHTVPLTDIIAGEWAENDPALRKDFMPTEAVAIKQAIEAQLKPAADARKKSGKKAQGERGQAGDRAASFTGKSRRTIEKAEKIVAAAERDPERYAKLRDNMDRSGRVDGPFKQLQTLTAAAEIRKSPPPAPGKGPYCGVVIDFPWAAEPEDDDPERLARGYYPYPTMSISQIAEYCRDVILPVLDVNAVVGIWIPNYHLALGHQLPVLGALGLKAATILTWRKNLIGRGQVARGSTEHKIIARCGKAVIETPFPRTDFEAGVDRKNHSRKPQSFFDLFAKHVPAPRYASFFDTVDRGPLWDVHGVPHKKESGGEGRMNHAYPVATHKR